MQSTTITAVRRSEVHGRLWTEEAYISVFAKSSKDTSSQQLSDWTICRNSPCWSSWVWCFHRACCEVYDLVEVTGQWFPTLDEYQGQQDDSSKTARLRSPSLSFCKLAVLHNLGIRRLLREAQQDSEGVLRSTCAAGVVVPHRPPRKAPGGPPWARKCNMRIYARKPLNLKRAFLPSKNIFLPNVKGCLTFFFCATSFSYATKHIARPETCLTPRAIHLRAPVARNRNSDPNDAQRNSATANECPVCAYFFGFWVKARGNFRRRAEMEVL